MKVKGIVESVSQESIEGWVIVSDDKDNIVESPKVELRVNGQVVAITFAVREVLHLNFSKKNCGFKFLIKDLYKYVNVTDNITVHSCGEDLPFYLYGMSYKTKNNGKFNTNDLFLKRKEGYVFDSNGEFNVSLRKNENIRKESFDLYYKLNDFFEEKLSYNLFACYGTLLGIVREKNFIFNDGNFDCAYFSREHNKEAVIHEFKSIAKMLIKNNYYVKVYNSHIEVSIDESKQYINIYCSWLNEDSEYMLSFNYIGNKLVNREGLFEIKTSSILGYEILIPKDYKGILNQIYGKEWEMPDFGFEWNTTDVEESFLSYNDRNEIYWEQYYLKAKKQKPSTFCTFINNFITKKYLILDIGCGLARDSIEFANQGHQVIGIDKSKEAISAANSLSEKEGYDNIEFYAIDISDEIIFSEKLRVFKEKAHRKNVNIMYYFRFFLHSIDEEIEDKLLNAISSYLEKGDIFAAEFRIKEDETRYKEHGDHYRRFIDEEILIDKLKKKYGMTKLVLFQKGNGFSIYKREDPFVARIILEK